MSKIGDFLRRLFTGMKREFEQLEPTLKDALRIGCELVDRLKTFVNSDEADILTAIIPGHWDDNVKELLRDALPKILLEMQLAATCADKTDPNEIIKCAIATFQQITGDWISDGARKNFYDSLAVLIAQIAADGKLDWDDAKKLIKFYYENIYKP